MRKKRAENIFDRIIAENLPYLGRKQRSRSRKHRESQTRWTQRDGMPIHVMIKLANLKIQRTLKAAREKQRIIHEGTPLYKAISLLFSRDTTD